jgi:hypothetical protein
VRMADHPGKFDIESAKAFALVPRLHYAALKRGESVIASDCPLPTPPPPPFLHDCARFASYDSPLQLMVSRFMPVK